MADITFAQIVALRNGIDPVLSGLESLLTSAFLQSLPIVGTKLADTAKTEAALQQYQALETGIVKALDALNDPAGYAAATLTKSINDAITQAGFSGNAVVVVSPSGTLSVQLLETASMSYSQPLGTNFGIPNLSIATSGTAGATIGYSVNLGATVDANNGFALSPATAPALDVSLALATPTFTADATVGPVKFNATDNGSVLSGDFKLDTAGHATFSGDATLGLHLKSDLGSGALPSISADLAGTWHFGNAAINPADPASFGDKPTIGFNNVSYDLGSFFETFLKPVLDKIAPVLAPIHTALAVFNTDLTFIKGLFGPAWHALDVAGHTDGSGNDTGDGRITLLDFLKAGLTLSGHPQNVGPIQSFLDTLDKVVNLAAYLDNVQLGPASYNLGSFNISGDLRQQGFDAANAAINVLAPGQNITTVLKGLGGAYAAQVPGSTQVTSDKLIGVLNDPTFAFPILTPTSAFALLLGGTTDLFDFTPPAVGIALGSIAANGAPTSSIGPIATIPIFPGIELDVNAALDASLALGFGYDTRGLKDYSAGGYSDPGKLLDGLFISNPANGQPVLRVAGDVSLALNFGVPGTNVGGGGDIGGDIEFSLPGTGRAYLGPFLNTLSSDPLAALDASGKITAGFDAGVNIGGVNVYTYNSPRLTLASFNHRATQQTGPATTVVTAVAVSAIDDDTALTTGIETPGHVIRITVTFSNGVVLDPDTTTLTLQLNDLGTTTINRALTKAAAGNQLVFEYRVLPSDTTIKLLGIQGVTGTIKDVNGNAVDASAAVTMTFAGLGIDTSEPREFTAPSGDFNVQASFNRAFVAVSAGGQDLLLYGNAIIDTGSTATFHQDSADVTTLVVQAGGALDMQRGVLRINGGLTQSENRGTITVGAAQLSLKGDIHNYGVLALGAVAGTPTLTLLQDTNTLSGGGQVLLSDSDANLIGGGPAVGNASGLPVLVNADNTISGAGTIGGYAPDGSTGLDLVNRSLIAGTGTHQLRLLATTTNTGTLSGTGTGGLAIRTTVDNTGGTIAASGGGVLTLGDKADVTGGTFATPGGTDTARITTAGVAAIHGPVALNAFLAVGAGARLQVTGTVLQAHYAPPGANTARLSAGGGVLELVSGTILSGGYLTTGAGGLVSVTGPATLSGGGGNTTTNGLGLLTDATISVAGTTTLTLQAGVINRGTITTAGGVAIYDTLDNAGGTVAATAAGRITLDSGSTVMGGALRGAVFAQGGATLDGRLSPLQTLGVLTATASTVNSVSYGLHLKGVIDQYGDAATAGTIVAKDVDVTLDSATLKNGTLQTVGTGRFVLNGASVLDGTSHGLQLPATVTVTPNGTATIRGDIVNKGSVVLDGSFGSAQQATLSVSGAASLSGGGTVVLETFDRAYSDRAGVITGTGTGDTLDNIDNTISGYGYIGAGKLGFSNEAAGVVDATTTTLTLQTAQGVNRGLIEATTGTLLFESAFDNADGRITAAGGSLLLGGGPIAASIAGGSLAATGAGTMHVQVGQALTLDGRAQAVTIGGTLHVDRAAVLTAKGSVVNTGTLALDGSFGAAQQAFLSVAGQATLSGGGTVVLDTFDNPYADRAGVITGSSTADALDNADNTISGYGYIGQGKLSLTNEAAGVVDATSLMLTLDTGSSTVVNRGLLEATAAGTLAVASAVANSGTILAAATGTVVLDRAVTGNGTVQAAATGRLILAGGSLVGTGSVASAVGGTIEVQLGSTGLIEGTAQSVTLAGQTVVDRAASLTLTGAIVNTGTVVLNGSFYAAQQATLLVSGAASLSGGGAIVLESLDNPYADRAGVITGSSAGDMLDNIDNTISGYGYLGAGKLTFTNEAAGLVNATSLVLTLQTAQGVNRGLIEATAGTLLYQSVFDNAGGRIVAADGAVLLGGGPIAARIAGGTLAATGTGTMHVQVGQTLALDGTAQAVSVAGTLHVDRNAVLTVQGTLRNTGVFTCKTARRRRNFFSQERPPTDPP